jgi:uncharacterized membrane protein/Mg-chelatase subunit ChlD
MLPSASGSPSLYLRILALAAVVAAPLVPPLHREGRGRAVMLVVDRSASVGPEGRAAAERFVREALEKRGDARVGVIAFDGKPEVRGTLDGVAVAAAEDGVPRLGEVTSPGTDVAAAVRLAAAVLPDAGERRIVLLSDGRGTRGDALAEVRRAGDTGIVVDTVPIGAPSGKLTLTRVAAREPRVADGEPATVVAELRGTPGEKLTLEWLRDGKRIKSERMTLPEDGVAKPVLTDAHPGTGVHVYAARIGGARAELRSGSAAVDVAGKPRALVVSFDGECPAVLADALDQAGVERVRATLGETPIDAAALSAADVVVLADVPLAPAGSGEGAAGLTPKQQEALVEYAQKGGGVFALGGAFGFAPEYADTPLARMLPVEIENQGQLEDPRVAMAIMLDRSGSMAASVGTHTKIQLAVEAALAAASTLRPDDVLALGSVDTQTTWNQPLGPISGLEARRAAIRTIDAGGGGIYVYTALVDAYAALAHAATPVRHVILFADTADAEEQAESCFYGHCPDAPRSAGEIAQTARRSGITTSVVGIGREQDSDTDFLRKLAVSGGGRFYITGNAADLRRIFVSEARVATRSNLREGPVSVAVAEDHPILAGVDVSAFPPLGGFVETRRRATADTALITRAGSRPILASWRYGLGKVVAITTDLRADWKSGWSSFHGAGQVLRQAVRFALRRHGAGAADVRVALGERGAVVTIDVGDAPGDQAPAAVEAFAFAADGVMEPTPATLERVAPGRFAARAPAGSQPFVLARVRDAAGALLGEGLGQSDAAEELAALGPDERALRDLAGVGAGVFDPEPSAALRAGGPRGRERVPTWPWVLVAAAGLVVADLWLRRLGKRRALPASIAARSMGAAPAADPGEMGVEAA